MQKRSPIPKEKHLSPAQLAIVFPYLEKQADALADKVDKLNAADAWEQEYNSIKDGDGSAATASLDPNNESLNR